MRPSAQPDPHADSAPAVSNSANHAHPNRHRSVAARAILAAVLGLIAMLGVSALATHTHPLTRAAGGIDTAYGVTSSPATTARRRPSAAITLAAFTTALDPSSAPLVARPSARGRAALSMRPVHRTSPTRLAGSRLKPLPCPDGPVTEKHWDPTRPTNPALHPVSGLHVQLGPVDVALGSVTATAGSHGGRGRHDSDCGCATPAPPAWVPGPWGVPPTVRGHHSSYMPAYPTGSVPNTYVPSAYPNGYAPNPYNPNPYNPNPHNPGAYNGYPRTYPSYQGSYYPTGTAASGYYPPNPSARPTSGNLCLTGSGGSGYTVINSSGQLLCQLTTAGPAPSAVAPVSW